MVTLSEGSEFQESLRLLSQFRNQHVIYLPRETLAVSCNLQALYLLYILYNEIPTVVSDTSCPSFSLYS